MTTSIYDQIAGAERRMIFNNPAIDRAHRFTIGFGVLACVVGLFAVGLALAGGDGTTPALQWLMQGFVLLLVGAIEIYSGRKLIAGVDQARRHLRILSWLMLVSLAIGILSLLAGDFSVVLPMLINLLLLSYYRSAKRSLQSAF
jgi:hypothetical protein